MQLNTRFGDYGGLFAPEVLIPALEEIENAFISIQNDNKFQNQLNDLLKNYAGRSTPLTYAENLSKKYNCNVFLKREDLLHGGAHKTNNTIGQLLLAKYLGKTRIIAETGAGQHGVATAMIGAKLGLKVHVYMGATDIARQSQNVERMKLFGAEIHSVKSGSATLKDAINEAMRDWITNAEHTYYCFGTAAGPHPFPTLVKYFQNVIGVEAREQIINRTGKLPDAIFACIGGGSNAIGLYNAFLEDKSVEIFGAEAAGKGINTKFHASTLNKGTIGVFHGMKSLLLQNDEGQITEPYSISAGLDYPGIGPEHSYLQSLNRVIYEPITDKQAIESYEILSKVEAIIPAFESSHAVALALSYLKKNENKTIIINISGRGDKDLNSYWEYKNAK